MAHRRKAIAASTIIIVVSSLALAFRGLDFGIELTGGLLLEAAYATPVDLAEIRSVLANAGFPNASIQNFGSSSDVLVRLPPQSELVDAETVEDRVLEPLRSLDLSATLRRIEFIGPQVGSDLVDQGGLAIIFTLIMVFGYVMMRFKWKFAAGAIVALIHDVIVTTGFFSIVNLSFDLTVLGSLLAVIGYSLNDTIVVFDRIRENFRLIRRQRADVIIDTSINQTLARTLITGLTTLLVLIALLVVGGEALEGFSIALIVGIIVGTYSSIYIASSTALALKVAPADLLAPNREELDKLP